MVYLITHIVFRHRSRYHVAKKDSFTLQEGHHATVSRVNETCFGTWEDSP